ncbi:hypothetical protein [Microcoleus sp. herbarium5]|uniref:hypothetical protein n=1 Tax=Microcoleus sp. herbarium5 TaxID=3055434 RepID=UPI002FD3BA3F
MPAPIGSRNGEKAWFKGTSEEKTNLSARVSVSLRDQVKAALQSDESISEFLIRAIELLIRERSQKAE